MQCFLKEVKSYVGVKESPPFSPNKNPLDHQICKKVKQKEYEGWLNKPFCKKEKFMAWIKVWDECATNKSENCRPSSH